MVRYVEGGSEQRAVAADSTRITTHPGTGCLHAEVGFRLTGPKPKNSSLGLRRQNNADQQSPQFCGGGRATQSGGKPVNESDGPALLSLASSTPRVFETPRVVG